MHCSRLKMYIEISASVNSWECHSKDRLIWASWSYPKRWRRKIDLFTVQLHRSIPNNTCTNWHATNFAHLLTTCILLFIYIWTSCIGSILPWSPRLIIGWGIVCSWQSQEGSTFCNEKKLRRVLDMHMYTNVCREPKASCIFVINKTKADWNDLFFICNEWKEAKTVFISVLKWVCCMTPNSALNTSLCVQAGPRAKNKQWACAISAIDYILSASRLQYCW